MRAFLAIIALSSLLTLSCGLVDRYEIAFDVDGRTLNAAGATICLQKVDDVFVASLTDRASTMKLEWTVPEKTPSKWHGGRFRGTLIEVNTPPVFHEFQENMVGILIEITDVTGRTVSGKFSGQVGLGEGSIQIDNGVFRAYVEF
jgi:hypothetical protein